MKRFVFCALAFWFLCGQQADAQQGKYVNSASARLVKLIDQANRDNYKLQNNGFSIGGGWLKQGTNNWVPIYTTTLTKGVEYRFMAVGDMDAKDVDIQILNASGTTVASDTATAPEAVVNFRPTQSGQYTVRLRLYSSAGDVPSVCVAIMMVK